MYFGLTAAASLVTQLGCGSFIVRYGALRMSQISLAMVAGGTALAAVGTPLTLIASALICGGGGAVSTPASSHLLARCSSPRYLPLVFSIKQTAVPAGLLLAGALGPQLTEWMSWRFTMVLSAAASASFVLMLQPLRKSFDGVTKAVSAQNGDAPLDTLVAFIEHNGEHYGQLVLYSRLKGIVPPASRA